MSATLPPPPELGDALPVEGHPDVLAFLAHRRSVEAPALTAPGPDAGQIDELLRLAARVPDHGKLAPWRFVVLEGEGKAAFAQALEQLAASRGDTVAVAKLGKLKIPPLSIAVIASPREGPLPEWEQILSAGAACTTLTYAAAAMGFGANWLTGWYAYDPEAQAILGLAPHEKVAGFVMIGSAREPPRERTRPELAQHVTRWTPKA